MIKALEQRINLSFPLILEWCKNLSYNKTAPHALSNVHGNMRWFCHQDLWNAFQACDKHSEFLSGVHVSRPVHDDEHSRWSITTKMLENVQKVYELIYEDEQSMAGISNGVCQEILTVKPEHASCCCNVFLSSWHSIRSSGVLTSAVSFMRWLTTTQLSSLEFIMGDEILVHLDPCDITMLLKMKIKLNGCHFDTADEIQM